MTEGSSELTDSQQDDVRALAAALHQDRKAAKEREAREGWTGCAHSEGKQTKSMFRYAEATALSSSVAASTNGGCPVASTTAAQRSPWVSTCLRKRVASGIGT